MEGNEDNAGEEIWENGEKILSPHVPCVICGGFGKIGILARCQWCIPHNVR